ncbi:MAG: DNA polymerase II [Sandaracinaceae bacterium]|nr:DNA polymerase II [Sandaracinaceae bacterium]
MSATAETDAIPCFLLSREWRDGRRGVEITLWGLSERGAVKVICETEAVMFVPRRIARERTDALGARREEVALRSLAGEDVDALYFPGQRALVHAREQLRGELAIPLESDLKPSDRFLMERFVTGAFEVKGRVTSGRVGKGPDVRVVREARVRGLERPGREAVPLCTVASLDLETDGVDGAILSFALVVRGPLRHEGIPRESVVVVRAADAPRISSVDDAAYDPSLVFVPDERALCQTLLDRIALLDPDVIVGWNVIEFDLTVLEERCRVLGVPFVMGRNAEPARILPGDRGQVSVARIPGRVVLDGIATLKNATWSFERYTLEHVSRELLGRGKKIDASARSKQDKIDEIRRMARDDPRALATYNLEDARLVADIVEKADLLGFAFSRAELVGLPLDRQGGAVAAFDHLYLPRLHRAGFVAPDVGVEVEAVQSPGGEVLESVPGLHREVLAFDFRSLYPSIIRTFKIDPLGLQLALHLAPSARPGGAASPAAGRLDPSLVGGFDGASFTREPSILPPLIERLTEARIRAQSEGNEALSRAIKIQMNSFYGVLGTPGCRFFDPRLASSITRRGHAVIHRAKRFFEDEGLCVLYGDTDSLFVHVEPRAKGAAARALGKELAARMNQVLADEIAREHDLVSALELRFDQHFAVFLMPTMRGTDVGSKKRYAGAVYKEGGTLELVLRGLEAVRTDWTPLARRVQRELLERVFTGQPWEGWLVDLREQLVRGKLDRELVYRKRLRRDLDAYGAAPPHVRAARLKESTGEITEGEIEYVMTSKGPLPIEQLTRGTPIDYAHYLDKQLAPACDVVLPLLGTSFARLCGTQLSLF